MSLKLIPKIAIAALASVALSVGAVGTVQATPNQYEGNAVAVSKKTAPLGSGLSGKSTILPFETSGGNTCSMKKIAESITPVRDSEVKQAYLNKFAEILSSGSAFFHVAIEDIRLQEASVNKVPANGEDYYAVTVPLNDHKYMLMSGITAIYDSTGILQSVSESLVYENASKNFEVVTYENGVLTHKEDIGERYVPNSELRAQLKELSPGNGTEIVPMGWGEKVACVAATLGVGVVFAKIIVGVCGASCAAAATGVGAAVCGACITGIVGVAGASLAVIYQCFQL